MIVGNVGAVVQPNVKRRWLFVDRAQRLHDDPAGGHAVAAGLGGPSEPAGRGRGRAGVLHARLYGHDAAGLGAIASLAPEGEGPLAAGRAWVARSRRARVHGWRWSRSSACRRPSVSSARSTCSAWRSRAGTCCLPSSASWPRSFGCVYLRVVITMYMAEPAEDAAAPAPLRGGQALRSRWPPRTCSFRDLPNVVRRLKEWHESIQAAPESMIG